MVVSALHCTNCNVLFRVSFSGTLLSEAMLQIIVKKTNVNVMLYNFISKSFKVSRFKKEMLSANMLRFLNKNIEGLHLCVKWNSRGQPLTQNSLSYVKGDPNSCVWPLSLLL